MRIRVEPERAKKTKWNEYLLRFVFGGIVTLLAGIIAKKAGPGVGGLFLAFPAILPASVTLIEKHEKSCFASGVDSAGAVVGAVGLLFFAGTVLLTAGRWPAWLTLLTAFVVWSAVSFAIWWTWRESVHRRPTLRDAPRVTSKQIGNPLERQQP